MSLATQNPVLVTGASGFIAGHVINSLLTKGYKVRGTYRPASEDRCSHLKTLPNAVDNLELVEADLCDHGECWDKAFAGGVEFVFHIAAPYKLKPDDVDRELMEPIVSGTLHILNMCNKTPSVKKLVMTSCMSAVCDEFDNNKVYDEKDWNALSSLTRNPYAFSKATAELGAHNFVKRPECTFKLVTLLPFMVLGPHLASRLSFSHRFILGFLDRNRSAVLNLNYCISDVRDVAHAHIVAIETESVKGRYCLCNAAEPLSAILQMVHENFKDITVPTRKVRDFVVRWFISSDKSFRGEFIRYNLGRAPKVDCSKATDVGMILRPTVQTINDTVRFLRDNDLMHETFDDVVEPTGGCAIC